MKGEIYFPVVLFVIYFVLVNTIIINNRSLLDNVIGLFFVMYYGCINIKYGIIATLAFIVYKMSLPLYHNTIYFTEGFDSSILNGVTKNNENKGSYIENRIITPNNTRVNCINLTKNTDRLQNVKSMYAASDLVAFPFNRFNAIYGRDVDINLWLTDTTIVELKKVEDRKYRTHHHQLTYGGVGCFLSHYTLALNLANDIKNEYYIVLEDDINIVKDTYAKIESYVKNAPDDWDILLFGYFRLSDVKVKTDYMKPKGFWGMQGYIINKKGASKLVNEVDAQRIDGQVDSYLSRMQQQGKINIYATREQLVYSNELSNKTNIQIPLLTRDGSF
jgi:GR25 family glycosyltransferase involved in LPS biosynthesis